MPRKLCGTRPLRYGFAAGLLLGAIAAGAAYVTARPVYEASAQIRFLETNGAQIAEQIALLKDPAVAQAVVAKPEIASLPIFLGIEQPDAWLHSQLRFAAPAGSDAITISLRDHHRESVAKVVQATRDAVLEKAGMMQAIELGDLKEHLVRDQQREIASIDRLMILFRQRRRAEDFRPGDSEAFDLNEFLSERVKDAANEFELKVAQLADMQRTLGPAGAIVISPLQLDEQVDRQPMVREAIHDRDAKELACRELEKRVPASDPEVARRRRELEAAAQRLAELRESTRSQVAAELLGRARKVSARRLEELRLDVDSVARRREFLEQERAADGNKESVLGRFEPIELLKLELERVKKSYLRIGERMEEIESVTGAHRMVESPPLVEEPTHPVAGDRLRSALVAGAIGFSVPFLLMLLTMALGSLESAWGQPRNTGVAAGSA